MLIALDQIHSARGPVRTAPTDDAFNELVESIRSQGQIVPIKLRPHPDLAGEYEVVYGHRRLAAMRRNGAMEIEAIVEGIDDTTALIQALIENVQREDMTPLDEGRAYLQLQDAHGLSQRTIATRIGKSQAWISQCISLVRDPAMQPFDCARNQADTAHKARVIRQALPDSEPLRRAVVVKVITEDLTSRQAARLAESVAAAPSEQAQKMLLDHEYSPVIHDPEHIAERAQRFGAHDPLYHQDDPWRERRAQRILDKPALVKQFIGAINNFYREAEILDVGKVKFSPEAKKYTIGKLKALARKINEYIEILEKP